MRELGDREGEEADAIRAKALENPSMRSGRYYWEHELDESQNNQEISVLLTLNATGLRAHTKRIEEMLEASEVFSEAQAREAIEAHAPKKEGNARGRNFFSRERAQRERVMPMGGRRWRFEGHYRGRRAM